MVCMREAKGGFRAIVASLALACEEIINQGKLPRLAAWQARLQDLKKTCSTFMELNVASLAIGWISSITLGARQWNGDKLEMPG